MYTCSCLTTLPKLFYIITIFSVINNSAMSTVMLLLTVLKCMSPTGVLEYKVYLSMLLMHTQAVYTPTANAITYIVH